MKFIIILFFMSTWSFSMAGLDLAQLLDSREKPNDI